MSFMTLSKEVGNGVRGSRERCFAAHDAPAARTAAAQRVSSYTSEQECYAAGCSPNR